MIRDVHQHFTKFAGAAALAATLGAPTVSANGEIVTPRRQAPAPAPVPALDVQAQGTQEVEVSAGFFHADGSDTGTISGDVGYGYYVAPRLSLGLR